MEPPKLICTTWQFDRVYYDTTHKYKLLNILHAAVKTWHEITQDDSARGPRPGHKVLTSKSQMGSIAEDFGFIAVWDQERMKRIALLLFKGRTWGRKSTFFPKKASERALFWSWRSFMGATIALWCTLYTSKIWKFLVKFDSPWWAWETGRRRSWSCWWCRCQYWWHLFDGNAWQSSHRETPWKLLDCA